MLFPAVPGHAGCYQWDERRADRSHGHDLGEYSDLRLLFRLDGQQRSISRSENDSVGVNHFERFLGLFEMSD